MNVSVFGLGYVGLATSLCLAELGHCVIGVDVDSKKIQRLQAQEPLLPEPEFSSLLSKHVLSKNLSFTTNFFSALQDSDVLVISLGTPSNADGSVNVQDIYELIESIATEAKSKKTVIMKSTVPVGTCDAIEKIFADKVKSRNKPVSFSVISNPEFLREGSAIKDALSPARVVIGVDNPEDKAFAQDFYSGLSCPVLFMSRKSSELSKYTANALLAAKMSLMNEISRLADLVGGDMEDVRVAVGLDPRIGNQFLHVSAGFGGPCLSKDLLGLIDQGKKADLELNLIEAVNRVNQTQPVWFFEKIKSRLKEFEGKRVSLWGVSFKEGVGDIRNSAALSFIDLALSEGATLQVHDPMALDELKIYLQENHPTKMESVLFFDDVYQALSNSHALVVMTGWGVYRSADLEKVKKSLLNPLVFDGRNLFSTQQMKAHQIEYHSVGRQKAGPHEV